MSDTNRPPTARIGTWNTEWAVPGRAKGGRVRTALADPDCDILCVTEGSAGLLPQQGHIIDAGTNWGYPLRNEDRRKVLLWSRHPWNEKDCFGRAGFPDGRIVKGVTETPIGPLTAVGVCIPWEGAHVTSGRKDRKSWDDHKAWLKAFEGLPWRRTTDRLVVLGDFNQRLPRTRVPIAVHEALRQAFAGLKITTAGDVPGAPGLIDHIAHSKDLQRVSPLGVWPKRRSRGEPLPDHFGVWANFSLAPPT